MTLDHVPFSLDESFAAFYPIPPVSPVSEAQFERWVATNSEAHAEWIDGEVSFLHPAGTIHNDVRWFIGSLMRLYSSRENLGRVLSNTWTKFKAPRPQLRCPDVLFVRAGQEHVITNRNVSEPPDLIIEVVSPDDESRDYREKFLLYEAA